MTFATSELFISRVTLDRKGVKRWFSNASGVDRDLFDERMSVELFKDFIKRAERGDKVPAPFSSEAWNGGLPYLGVAHYLDAGGEGIAGDTEHISIDGNKFIAEGVFRDSPIGSASYKSIKRDIDRKLPHARRTRISIAFLDLGHEHEGFGNFARKGMLEQCDMCLKGVSEKIYRAGHLVHLALTRRPAYPSASINIKE